MKLVKEIHPRIEQVITSFIQPYEQFYYVFFLARVNFYKALSGLPTMCATVVDMRLAICWNEDFLNSLDDNELRFLILHETFHLTMHHLERGKYFDPEKANIAMDMVINELLMKHYHKMKNGYVMCEMPKFTYEKCREMVEKVKANRELTAAQEKEIMDLNGKATGCVLDPNYKGELAFEPLYQWLMENHQKSKNGEPHELSPDTKTMLDNADMRSELMDVHVKMDEVGEEIKKQLVEETVAKARLEVSRSRGNVPGDVEEILSLLLKVPKTNNLKLLRRSISSLKGKTKQDSWKRLNRRVTGLKGKVGVAQEINAILDVSGSMWGRFEIVLKEIFRDNYVINLIEADTEVRSIQKITDKKQIQRLKMKGGGGTELSPAVHYVINPDNGLSKWPTILLTDGYCDSIDFRGSSCEFLILTTDELVHHSNGSRVKQIKIEA
jgi:predicted metal-dependent peptidase